MTTLAHARAHPVPESSAVDRMLLALAGALTAAVARRRERSASAADLHRARRMAADARGVVGAAVHQGLLPR